jgi:hypothetical protein
MPRTLVVGPFCIISGKSESGRSGVDGLNPNNLLASAAALEAGMSCLDMVSFQKEAVQNKCAGDDATTDQKSKNARGGC